MSVKRFQATHLAAILDDQGRKRSWLAKRVGISSEWLRQILNEQAYLSEELAVRIAEALGVPLFLAFDLADASEVAADETSPKEAVA